jgi:SAM-dependent methyltransferase
MEQVRRLRKHSDEPAGGGLLMSSAEWELRNDVLAETLCELVNRYRPRDATDALDVGAQSGALMDRYARLTGLQWGGVDPAFEAEHASPTGLRLLPAGSAELPFPDRSVHVVMLANVYEHIDPHERVQSMREIRRVLVPGGALVGQIPNPYFVIENHSRLPLMGYLPPRLQQQYWRLSRVPWDLDFYVVTPKHLRRDATAGGLEEALIRRFNYPLEVIPRQVRPIARLLDRPTRRLMPWAWQFVFTVPAQMH